jgi:hypothetical protein
MRWPARRGRGHPPPFPGCCSVLSKRVPTASVPSLVSAVVATLISVALLIAVAWPPPGWESALGRSSSVGSKENGPALPPSNAAAGRAGGPQTGHPRQPREGTARRLRRRERRRAAHRSRMGTGQPAVTELMSPASSRAAIGSERLVVVDADPQPELQDRLRTVRKARGTGRRQHSCRR